jgi:hypothetical protein
MDSHSTDSKIDAMSSSGTKMLNCFKKEGDKIMVHTLFDHFTGPNLRLKKNRDDPNKVAVQNEAMNRYEEY